MNIRTAAGTNRQIAGCPAAFRQEQILLPGLQPRLRPGRRRNGTGRGGGRDDEEPLCAGSGGPAPPYPEGHRKADPAERRSSLPHQRGADALAPLPGEHPDKAAGPACAGTRKTAEEGKPEVRDMSRGPPPAKGLDAALPVARARGNVMFFRRMRGSTADLMVSGSGMLAIILLRFASRLYGTPAEIALEFYDAVAVLRLHPAGGPVSRELWLYSRHGVLRFFRVEDDGIVELRADGSVMLVVPPVPAGTRKSWSRMKQPVEAGQPGAGESPGDPAAVGKIPAAPGKPMPAESPGIPAPDRSGIVALKQEPVADEGPGPVM